MTSYAIERDIEIDAPVDVVWRTITEPDLIRQWFADVADVDATPGATGSLTFRADSETPHVAAISVVDADRPHRFSYRWCHPTGTQATETNSTLVTFTLVADGDQRTRLRVTETGVDLIERTEAERQAFVDDHRHGWQVQGDRLRELLAAGGSSSR